MAGKVLGRTGLELSSFGPALSETDGGTLNALHVGHANWCDIPVELTANAWESLRSVIQHAFETQQGSAETGIGERRPWAGQELIVHARIRPGHWDRSMAGLVNGLRERVGIDTVHILELAPFDLERIKGGEPFRRVQDLRDAEQIRFMSVRVGNLKDALWAMDHMPIQALTVDGRLDAESLDKLLAVAEDTEIGVIATAACVDGDQTTAMAWLKSKPITAFAWPVDQGLEAAPRQEDTEGGVVPQT